MKSKSKISSPVPRGTLILISAFLSVIITTGGCQTAKGNVGRVNTYPVNSVEAAWIRDGEPIEFENELWYPADGIESFQDWEMLMVGNHRGVPFFVDKVDVRPFARLYTKFDRNKFRYFEKRSEE